MTRSTAESTADRIARQMALKLAGRGGAGLYPISVTTVDLDEDIGSLLEAWLTRDTGTMRCRFCGTELADAGVARDPQRRFCRPEHVQAWEKVMEARLVLGKRDLARRGFD